jgi:hypothetical protein
VRLFEIGAIVYAVQCIAMGLCGFAIAKKRAGPLMADFLRSRKEIGEALRRGATSPWDPFSQNGAKRWRLILFAEFGLLIALSFLAL